MEMKKKWEIRVGSVEMDRFDRKRWSSAEDKYVDTVPEDEKHSVWNDYSKAKEVYDGIYLDYTANMGCSTKYNIHEYKQLIEIDYYVDDCGEDYEKTVDTLEMDFREEPDEEEDDFWAWANEEEEEE